MTPQEDNLDQTPVRLRVMLADYSTMLRLLKHDIESLLGRPIYDEPALLPEHGPAPDGVPF